MEPLNSTASHTLTIEVVSGLGGVYVQSCSINGAPLPAAIIPHDVLQVMLCDDCRVPCLCMCCHFHACVAISMHVLHCVQSNTAFCSRLPPGPYPTRPLCTSASTLTTLQTVAAFATFVTLFEICRLFALF